MCVWQGDGGVKVESSREQREAKGLEHSDATCYQASSHRFLSTAVRVHVTDEKTVAQNLSNLPKLPQLERTEPGLKSRHVRAPALFWVL